ncbi:MAG TPA: biotin--[acetyl-CoA-carboxylase] ligase, partial [Candidatus Obscuribacterales bacterium]
PPQLSLESFQSYLSTRRLGRAPAWPNELWESIDSTNNRAAELAARGAPEGVIVTARRQTSGRGRQGRVWLSPPDSGLYVSFLLRPQGPRSLLPMHTLACGVAAAKAIWQCVGVRIGLKWVNDLVIEGKKLGGILAEMPACAASGTASGDLPAPLILGVGINLRMSPSEIPEELRDRVEWLERCTQQPVDPNQLLAFLALFLEQEYDRLESGNSAEVIEGWKQFSVTLGREIRAASSGSTIEGTAVDLSDTGGLIVETRDGKRITLHAGEISIRAADGSYA